MNSVEVSIIIPAYNAQAFIEKCISSVLQQTFVDFELIIVDDGSTDQTFEICSGIATSDGRIRVIHKENGGSSSAKNYGIQNAKGRYIAFVDADDTIDEDYIRNLYQGIALHDADVCIGNVAFVNMVNDEIDSKRTVEMLGGVFTLSEFMSFYSKYMPNAVIGAPWNKLYRRSIIIENSLCFNTSIKNNEDTHFNYEFLAKCKTFYVSDSPYYNYISRIGVASASRKYIPNIFDIYVMTYNKAIEFLKATNSYENNVRFQNSYFIGLIIGAINGIVNNDMVSSNSEKIEKIKAICNHKDVRFAIKNCKLKNFKQKIIKLFMRYKMAKLLFKVFKANKK